MYIYSYFIANLGMIFIWVVLFLLRKDLRKQMIALSLIFGFAGVLAEFVYIKDWWHPLTITGTQVGIEDFMFGFWSGGILTVIYEEVFKKMIYPRKFSKENKLTHAFIFLSSLGILFFASFFFLKLSSFNASLVALLPLIVFIWIKRQDLIPDSIATGFLAITIGFLWFWIPEIITPNWVNNYWTWKNLSGITIFTAPIEDLIWFFLVGILVGPLYEFWMGSRLATYKSVRKRKNR